MTETVKPGTKVSCIVEQSLPNYLLVTYKSGSRLFRGILIDERCSQVKRVAIEEPVPVSKPQLTTQIILDAKSSVKKATGRHNITLRSSVSKSSSCLVLDDYDLSKPVEESPIESIRGLVERIDCNVKLDLPEVSCEPCKNEPLKVRTSSRLEERRKRKDEDTDKKLNTELHQRNADIIEKAVAQDHPEEKVSILDPQPVTTTISTLVVKQGTSIRRKRKPDFVPQVNPPLKMKIKVSSFGTSSPILVSSSMQALHTETITISDQSLNVSNISSKSPKQKSRSAKRIDPLVIALRNIKNHRSPQKVKQMGKKAARPNKEEVDAENSTVAEGEHVMKDCHEKKLIKSDLKWQSDDGKQICVSQDTSSKEMSFSKTALDPNPGSFKAELVGEVSVKKVIELVGNLGQNKTITSSQMRVHNTRYKGTKSVVHLIKGRTQKKEDSGPKNSQQSQFDTQTKIDNNAQVSKNNMIRRSPRKDTSKRATLVELESERTGSSTDFGPKNILRRNKSIKTLLLNDISKSRDLVDNAPLSDFTSYKECSQAPDFDKSAITTCIVSDKSHLGQVRSGDLTGQLTSKREYTQSETQVIPSSSTKVKDQILLSPIVLKKKDQIKKTPKRNLSESNIPETDGKHSSFRECKIQRKVRTGGKGSITADVTQSSKKSSVKSMSLQTGPLESFAGRSQDFQVSRHLKHTATTTRSDLNSLKEGVCTEGTLNSPKDRENAAIGNVLDRQSGFKSFKLSSYRHPVTGTRRKRDAENAGLLEHPSGTKLSKRSSFKSVSTRKRLINSPNSCAMSPDTITLQVPSGHSQQQSHQNATLNDESSLNNIKDGPVVGYVTPQESYLFNEVTKGTFSGEITAKASNLYNKTTKEEAAERNYKRIKTGHSTGKSTGGDIHNDPLTPSLACARQEIRKSRKRRKTTKELLQTKDGNKRKAVKGKLKKISDKEGTRRKWIGSNKINKDKFSEKSSFKSSTRIEKQGKGKREVPQGPVSKGTPGEDQDRNMKNRFSQEEGPDFISVGQSKNKDHYSCLDSNDKEKLVMGKDENATSDSRRALDVSPKAESKLKNTEEKQILKKVFHRPRILRASSKKYNKSIPNLRIEPVSGQGAHSFRENIAAINLFQKEKNISHIVPPAQSGMCTSVLSPTLYAVNTSLLVRSNRTGMDNSDFLRSLFNIPMCSESKPLIFSDNGAPSSKVFTVKDTAKNIKTEGKNQGNTASVQSGYAPACSSLGHISRLDPFQGDTGLPLQNVKDSSGIIPSISNSPVVAGAGVIKDIFTTPCSKSESQIIDSISKKDTVAQPDVIITQATKWKGQSVIAKEYALDLLQSPGPGNCRGAFNKFDENLSNPQRSSEKLRSEQCNHNSLVKSQKSKKRKPNRQRYCSIKSFDLRSKRLQGSRRIMAANKPFYIKKGPKLIGSLLSPAVVIRDLASSSRSDSNSHFISTYEKEVNSGPSESVQHSPRVVDSSLRTQKSTYPVTCVVTSEHIVPVTYSNVSCISSTNVQCLGPSTYDIFPSNSSSICTLTERMRDTLDQSSPLVISTASTVKAAAATSILVSETLSKLKRDPPPVTSPTTVIAPGRTKPQLPALTWRRERLILPRPPDITTSASFNTNIPLSSKESNSRDTSCRQEKDGGAVISCTVRISHNSVLFTSSAPSPLLPVFCHNLPTFQNRNFSFTENCQSEQEKSNLHMQQVRPLSHFATTGANLAVPAGITNENLGQYTSPKNLKGMDNVNTTECKTFTQSIQFFRMPILKNDIAQVSSNVKTSPASVDKNTTFVVPVRLGISNINAKLTQKDIQIKLSSDTTVPFSILPKVTPNKISQIPSKSLVATTPITEKSGSTMDDDMDLVCHETVSVSPEEKSKLLPQQSLDSFSGSSKCLSLPEIHTSPSSSGKAFATHSNRVHSSDSGNTSKLGKLEPGDIVWGKIYGHPWWPGRILKMVKTTENNADDREVRVAWFGSRTQSTISTKLLIPFLENFKSKFRRTKKGWYRAAVNEARVACSQKDRISN